MQAKSKTKLVITNPLHFNYFRGKYPVKAIGSTKGLVRDYAKELNFTEGLELYDSENNIESIIKRDQAASKKFNASYVTWKPSMASQNILGNSYELARNIESKASIRKILPANLFADFMVLDSNCITEKDYSIITKQLKTKKIVMQIDQSAGGKGTYFINSTKDYTEVYPILVKSNQLLVASKQISGEPRGLQCLIASNKLHYLNWWHKDLVNTEGICSIKWGSTKYCGAVLQNIDSDYKSKVQKLLKIVGDKLISLGYKGIFGVDILVDRKNKQVYLVEVNPRFTAVSHLYATAMYRVCYKSDFITLHTESLLDGYIDEAELHDFYDQRSLDQEYYYAKLQNLLRKSVNFSENCRLGVYDKHGQYKRFGFGIADLDGKAEVIVIPEGSHCNTFSRGDRTFSMIGVGDPLQINGNLTDAAMNVFRTFRQKLLV